MDLYELTIPVYIHALKNLDGWIEKSIAYANAKKFKPEVLLAARLAPDQFAFVKQVQSACDTAKFVGSKLAGQEAPSHPDTEQTAEELRARIKTCIDYLQSIPRSAFAGAESRRCAHVWMQGKGMRGEEYVRGYGLPNFFFHLTHAYAILRHNGVDLGKTDFLGKIPFID
ncbi:MAG: DUF1993 domain-containing protein [Myxococcota bacterium]